MKTVDNCRSYYEGKSSEHDGGEARVDGMATDLFFFNRSGKQERSDAKSGQEIFEVQSQFLARSRNVIFNGFFRKVELAGNLGNRAALQAVEAENLLCFFRQHADAIIECFHQIVVLYTPHRLRFLREGMFTVILERSSVGNLLIDVSNRLIFYRDAKVMFKVVNVEGMPALPETEKEVVYDLLGCFI